MISVVCELCLGPLCSKRHSRMKPHGCTGTVSAGSGSQNKSNKGWNLGTEPGFTTVTCRLKLVLMTYFWLRMTSRITIIAGSMWGTASQAILPPPTRIDSLAVKLEVELTIFVLWQHLTCTRTWPAQGKVLLRDCHYKICKNMLNCNHHQPPSTPTPRLVSVSAIVLHTAWW